jgi:hypothetical protein
MMAHIHFLILNKNKSRSALSAPGGVQIIAPIKYNFPALLFYHRQGGK